MRRTRYFDVLGRKIRARVRFTNSDRLFFIWLYRLFPSMLDALRIIRPETLVRWQPCRFSSYWCWKAAGGRPQIDAELRALIRRMSVDNPLWGAPRIYGELLKIGFKVAQSSVAKYMIEGAHLASHASWRMPPDRASKPRPQPSGPHLSPAGYSEK
jgi:hypothetical protein